MINSTKVITSEVTKRLVTEEDLLNLYNISLDEWEIEKKVVNTWETSAKNKEGKLEVTPLFQIKLWLKSKVHSKTLDQIRKEFIEDLKTISPKVPKKSFKSIFSQDTPKLLQLNLFDLHLGKHTWKEESGEDYNIEIACNVFTQAVDNFILKSKNYNIDKILLPVGNDFFNSDKSYPFNSTTKGTPQEEDTRWQKTFRTGRQLLVENIVKLSDIAPVQVVMVPGNHDFEKNFYLGDSLEGWFFNDENIQVDNNSSPRKYFRYNDILLGFTHGDNIKINDLPLIMAQERPNDWSETKHREFHLGHFHRKKTTSYNPVEELKGVTVRYMSCLGSTDAWHHSKGFIGNKKGAEAFIWDSKNGLEANLFYHVN